MINSPKEMALNLNSIGITPVATRGKIPFEKGWQKKKWSEKEIERTFTDGVNVGAVCGPSSGNNEIIDHDCCGEAYNEYVSLLEQKAPGLINSLVIEESPSGGYHLHYRTEEFQIPGSTKLASKRIVVSGPGEHSYKDKTYKATKDAGDWVICPDLIETRGEGGQAVIWPSPGYNLIQPAPDGNFSPPVISTKERQILIDTAKQFHEPLIKDTFQPPSTHKGELRPGDDYSNRATGQDIVALLEKHNWQTHSSNGDKTHVTRPGKKGSASATVYNTGVFHNFSSGTGDFEAWKAYSPFSVYGILEHNGDYSAAAKELDRQGYGSTKNGPQEERKTPQKEYRWSDLGNAEHLVDEHGDDLRYCHPFKKWLEWDGKRWANDNTGEIKRKCKAVIRKMYSEAGKEPDDEKRKKFIDYTRRCESDQKIKAMLSLAQSEPGIPILPEELDTNSWLLNCLNGTIDLKTGELQPHNREDLISKLAPFNYDPNASCNAWLDHLNKIMDGDQELISFLQRAFGYSLTGDTSERVIFIEWGTGANGKSITNDCIAMALGDYAMRTPTETLLIKRSDGIPNDVARLMGARFVYAAEAEQGKRLAESQIKDISGGEKIAARFMRGEWFEFYPEFKIWLGTNHKPIIRGTDNAIWDRIRLIPFDVRIPENERLSKTDILKMFEEEMPGILSWLVKGCLEWQQQGLEAPDAVLTATKGYRDEMDIIGDFIDDLCAVNENAAGTAKELYENYETWCDTEGEKTISKKLFGMKLRERGFDSYRASRGVRTWIGIGIIPEK